MERVKITYAIDLEEVPVEANKLSQEALHWAHVLLEDLTHLNFSKPLPEINEQVQAIRSTLARIDQRVDDCYAITAGYHQAINPAAVNQVPVHQQVQGAEDLTEKLRELQAQMAPEVHHDKE